MFLRNPTLQITEINFLFTFGTLKNENLQNYQWSLCKMVNLLQSMSPIKIDKARWLYLGQFWPLLNWAVILDAAETVPKIGRA